MKISIKSSKPLHRQVKDLILDEYLEDLHPGDKLPTELELVEKLNIGRKPVRKAFDELRKSGIVNRKAGVGTFYVGKSKKTCLNVIFYDDQASFEFIFDMYQHANPDITFNKINLGAPLGYSRRVMDMIARGEADVILMTGRVFQNFDAKTYLLPLSRNIDINRKNSYESPWNAFKYLRTYYAVPIAFSPVVMAYRKDLFENAHIKYPSLDWNWDDFLEKAIRLSSDKKVMEEEKQYGFLFMNGINRWPALIYQNGGSMRNADGEIDFSSPESKEAIKFIYDLFQKWKVSPFLENKGGLVPFSRAKIAMVPISYIQLQTLRKIKHFDWDIAPLPKKKNASTIAISYGFAAAANSRKLLEVSEFFKFCQSEVIQKNIAEKNSLLPVLESVANKFDCRQPEHYGIFKKLIPNLINIDISHNSLEEEIITEETNMLWGAMQTYEETCEHIKRRLYNSKLLGEGYAAAI